MCKYKQKIALFVSFISCLTFLLPMSFTNIYIAGALNIENCKGIEIATEKEVKSILNSNVKGSRYIFSLIA